MPFMSDGPKIGDANPAILHDYKAADAFLREHDTCTYQFGRQEGWLERDFADDSIALRYHNTNVITLYPDGATKFRADGWLTPSTQAWMNSNGRFDVSLYEPRGGERKPFRYSTIRFRGHDRNIEQRLREEWDMPGFVEMPFISRHAFEELHWREDGSHEWRVTNPAARDRAEAFATELAQRITARHPTYVYEDGIVFTKRGKCTNGTLLSDAIAEEQAARQEMMAHRRKLHGRIRAYTNRTMKALRAGMPIDDAMPTGREELRVLVERAEPSAALTMRIVASELPGDVRAWLNLHERDGMVVMGDLPPIAEQVVRRAVKKTLVQTLVA